MSEAPAVLGDELLVVTGGRDSLAVERKAREDAEACTRELTAREGVFCGISSGGAVCASLQLARELFDANIVTIICDRGDRYLTTGVFPESPKQVQP